MTVQNTHTHHCDNSVCTHIHIHTTLCQYSINSQTIQYSRHLRTQIQEDVFVLGLFTCLQILVPMAWARLRVWYCHPKVRNIAVSKVLDVVLNQKRPGNENEEWGAHAATFNSIYYGNEAERWRERGTDWRYWIPVRGSTRSDKWQITESNTEYSSLQDNGISVLGRQTQAFVHSLQKCYI